MSDAPAACLARAGARAARKAVAWSMPHGPAPLL